jgi:mannose-6-phosphate isomerase
MALAFVAGFVIIWFSDLTTSNLGTSACQRELYTVFPPLHNIPCYNYICNMQPPKPYREERPWGGFIELTRNIPSTVKIINVSPHEALSLQKHEKRDEFWKVLSGSGSVRVGTDRIAAETDKTFWIPRGTLHRMEAGEEMLTVLEISLGTFEDEDIIRLEDKYGRVG